MGISLVELYSKIASSLPGILLTHRPTRLGILEMVLHDQIKVLADFDQTITKKEPSIEHSQSKVLRSHLDRIRNMDKLATKTYEAVRTRLNMRYFLTISAQQSS